MEAEAYKVSPQRAVFLLMGFAFGMSKGCDSVV